MEGSLSRGERAQLELGLVAYWRKKLGLEARAPEEALTILYDHEQAGPLLRSLEDWLHRPNPPEDVDLQALLEPYRDLPADHAQILAHLVRLVSVQYQQHFDWRGGGAVPSEFEDHLTELVAARDAVPGRLLRVFKVPRRRAVYEALLAGGVDLIGTKTLDSSAKILVPRSIP